MNVRSIRLSYCLDCSADIRIAAQRAKDGKRPEDCAVCGSDLVVSQIPRESREPHRNGLKSGHHGAPMGQEFGATQGS
jgi:hypothetical protein